MTDDTCHLAFVPIRQLNEWVALGWRLVAEMDRPHSWWSVVCRWEGEGEPKAPKGVWL